MADDHTENEPLTKPKKPRTEKQIAATEKMRASLAEKHMSEKLSKDEEKKLFLKTVKDKLNNAPPPAPVEETDDEQSEEEEQAPPVKVSKKAPAAPVKVAKKAPVKRVVE